MHTVGSSAEAKRVREMGVDVCIAQGWEAGGHVWDQVATLPLVLRMVDAVAPLPVLAAGGIADGRGIKVDWTIQLCASTTRNAERCRGTGFVCRAKCRSCLRRSIRRDIGKG